MILGVQFKPQTQTLNFNAANNNLNVLMPKPKTQIRWLQTPYRNA